MKPLDLTRSQALQLKTRLINAPVAPGQYSHLINVGTTQLLDVLEDQYFRSQLADGISCFKYLEGDYGSGKTQFIHCLAQRAAASKIVTSIVDIGKECPFSSPLAIYRRVVCSFEPLREDDDDSTDRGLEVLLRSTIRARLRELGITPGQHVPDEAVAHVSKPFDSTWFGAPDAQTAAALRALGQRLVAHECGAQDTWSDNELVSWLRGDTIRSTTLKRTWGLHEPANDVNAFQRLKTVINFLRLKLNYSGFFVAFDEGTRVNVFRRGSTNQRQAIENMLTMINQNADGQFGGVMFMYAATPDFRTDVIQNIYIALKDRIGSIAFVPGQPMTPLIKLDDINDDQTLGDLGRRLMEVFELAEGVEWQADLQLANMGQLVDAEKRVLGFPKTVPPRYFVVHWCRFLEQQRHAQRPVTLADAMLFVEQNRVADADE